MNHITIVGRLTESVKVTKVDGKDNDFYSVRGRIADNIYRKNSDDITNFIDFSFARSNEPNTNYISRLAKGSEVVIMGEVVTSKNETDGHTYHNVRVNAKTVRAVGSSTSGDPESSEPTQTLSPSTSAAPVTDTPTDEDLPF